MPSKIYYGMHERYFFAKMGERKHAKISLLSSLQRNVKVDDYAGGFYAFKTLQGAKAYMSWQNGSDLVIVECQFERIFAEGEAWTGWNKSYKAFRAKYRTIIKEVEMT